MPGENILLIDTEKNVLLAYKAVLEDTGYNVIIATNEKEALEKLPSLQFEIIITELYLKGKNTISLIQEIKQRTPMAYIIVVTAATMNLDIYEQIINAGADDYFTKPFSPKTLLVNIKKGLGRRLLFKRNMQLEKNHRKLERFLASQHYCCGEDDTISNNLFFSTILRNEIKRAKRYNREFSVILFEIKLPDGRDTKGAHDVKTEMSDELLKHVLHSTRKTDIILDLNGHYAIILVETPKDGSRIFTKRLIQEITNMPIIKKNLHDQIEDNIKIDYITYPEQSDSITQLLGDAADN